MRTSSQSQAVRAKVSSRAMDRGPPADSARAASSGLFAPPLEEVPRTSVIPSTSAASSIVKIPAETCWSAVLCTCSICASVSMLQSFMTELILWSAVCCTASSRQARRRCDMACAQNGKKFARKAVAYTSAATFTSGTLACTEAVPLPRYGASQRKRWDSSRAACSAKSCLMASPMGGSDAGSPSFFPTLT